LHTNVRKRRSEAFVGLCGALEITLLQKSENRSIFDNGGLEVAYFFLDRPVTTSS